MNRKSFIKMGVGSTAGALFLPSFGQAASLDDSKPLKTSTIKEFVVAGHSKLDKVKDMLLDHPGLISSRYDWGNGDFEEAIEGAGHLGNKEIANYLIDQGARVNLFVLAMLGKTDLVQPVLEAYPKLIFSKGAHCFTLLHHAKVGGADSQKLYDYLMEKGLTETNIK